MSETKIALDVRKITVYVRRRLWVKGSGDEKGKMEQEIIAKLSKYRLPSELSEDVLEEHSVTKREQDLYKELASEYNKKREGESQESTLFTLKSKLTKASDALENKDLTSNLTLNELESLSEIANDVKKKINAIKNTLKKKENRKK